MSRDKQERTRYEGYLEFVERIGDNALTERYGESAKNGLSREVRPTIEHPDRIQDRQQAEQDRLADIEAAKTKWDRTITGEFEQARDGTRQTDQSPERQASNDNDRGESGSKMVKGDQPRPNMKPPPEIARPVDRQEFYKRMAEERFAEEKLQRDYGQDRDRDFDRDRGYELDRER